VGLFGQKRRARAQRWFFATDVHGSDRCYRKFLAAARVYEADVLLLGGDVAGKGIVPIVRDGEAYRYTFQGQEAVIDRAALARAETTIAFNGLYPWVCSFEEREELQDSRRRDAIFAELIARQLEDWSELTNERLSDNVRCIITPGNDDPTIVDEVLAASARIECPEGQIVDVGPMCLASLGNTNVTPWRTEREYSEEELARQIADIMVAARSGFGGLVFNFHCPPYNSGLDVAAELDSNLRPVTRSGGLVDIPVGSTAVRDAVEQYQPTVALHGHIHESRGLHKIGKSLCFNPGSEYASGILKGVIIDFDGIGAYRDHIFTSG
jgi:Icc-related predicted phosphoesterase